MLRALSRLAFAKSLRVFNAFAACATVLGSLLAALPAAAQTPERIANIEQTTYARVCDLFQVGGKIVYSASTSPSSSTCALFSTDAALTAAVPLLLGKQVQYSRKLGDRLVFIACDTSSFNCDAWSTDGTPSGTTRLGGPLAFSGFNALLGGHDGLPIWFAVSTQSGTRWSLTTDGSVAGTFDVGPAAVNSNSALPTANALIWVEADSTEWRVRRLLAPNGTVDTVATYARSEYTFFEPRASTSGRAYFQALRYDAPARADLISTAGNVGDATVLVTGPQYGSLVQVNRMGSTVAFVWCVSDCAWYRSDGTVAGTQKIPELDGFFNAAASLPGALIVSKVLNDGRTQIIRLSGTSASPVLSGAAASYAGANRDSIALCVPPGQPIDAGTWVGDGTPSGMQKLSSACFSLPSPSVKFGNSIFSGVDGPIVPSLSATEYPGATRTTLKGSPSGSAQFGAIAQRADGTAVFTACDTERRCGLWKTNGSATGTSPLMSFSITDPQFGPALFSTVGNNTYFWVTGAPVTPSGGPFSSTSSFMLGVTDGTQNGTRIVQTFPVSTFGTRFNSLRQDGYFRQLAGVTYFAACFENTPERCGLWSTDGTASGTKVVAPIAASTIPTFAAIDVVNNRLVLDWCESGFGCQLFSSDGTAAGTVSLGVLNSSGTRLSAVSGTSLFFATCTGGGPCTLRQTDGTAAGTTDATLLFPRTDLQITGIQPFGNRVLMTTRTTDFSSSHQLWILGGGSPATVIAGSLATAIGDVAEVDGYALFYATTRDVGGFNNALGLWSTDGTALGTRQISFNVANGQNTNGFILKPVVAGKSIAFQRCNSNSECEIWRTNALGTASTLIARLLPTSNSFSAPRENSFPYAAFGNRLVFIGDDGIEGRELWAVDVPQPIEGDADQDGIPDAIDNTANGTNPGVKDNNIFGNARLFAMQQARDFFGREATASEITTMVNAIASGTTRSALIEQMLNTPEHFDLYGPIIRLYQAYFLRPSDIGGLSFWVTQYKTRPASGWSFEGISEFFSLSPEFQQRYGALNTNQFVTLIYNNVLNRAPDTGGLAFWVDELDKGRRIRGNVMAGFSESPENKGKTKGEVQVATLYAVMLKQDIDPTVYAEWVPRINAGQSIRPLIDQLFAKPEYRARFLP